MRRVVAQSQQPGPIHKPAPRRANPPHARQQHRQTLAREQRQHRHIVHHRPRPMRTHPLHRAHQGRPPLAHRHQQHVMVRHHRRDRLPRHHEQQIELHIEMTRHEVDRRVHHQAPRRHQRQHPQPLPGPRPPHPKQHASRQRLRLEPERLRLPQPELREDRTIQQPRRLVLARRIDRRIQLLVRHAPERRRGQRRCPKHQWRPASLRQNRSYARIEPHPHRPPVSTGSA